METSETVGEIASAMAAFQSQAPAIVEGKSVSIPTKRGKLSFEYAPLEDILRAIRAPLAKHGLSIMQGMELDAQGKPCLTTRVMHASGEWCSTSAPMRTEEQTLKGLGSAMTYQRRYALTAMLGLESEADDGGEAAASGEAVARVREQRAAAPTESPLHETIIAHASKATKLDDMGSFTKRISEREGQGKLTEEQAYRCRQAVAKRTAELASEQAAGGKLFESSPISEGVGV